MDNMMDIKAETSEGSPHIRLDRFILRCPFCKRGFSRRADLDNHKLCLNLTSRKDTNNNVVLKQERRKCDMFSCPVCGENFHRWSVFCRHSSFHTYFSVLERKRPAEEAVKDRVCRSENPPAVHERETSASSEQETNTNKAARCKEEKNASYNKLKQFSSSLKSRRKTPKKKTRNHKCKICRRTFNSSGNLIVHMRVHSNYRPYKCKFCSHRFKQLCHVNNHERLHNGDTPWECTLCGKKFRQKGNLNSHLNKYH